MHNKKLSWYQRNYSNLDRDSFGGPSPDQKNLIPPTKYSSRGTDTWFWKLYYYRRFFYINCELIFCAFCPRLSTRVVWRESSAALGRLPVLSPFLAGNWDFHLLKQKVNKHRSATELCCLHWQIWAWDFLLAYNQWKMDYSNQFFHQTS